MIRQADNFATRPSSQVPDCTLVTSIAKADGIGRQGLGLLGSLKNDLSFNLVKMPPVIERDLDDETIALINKPFTSPGNTLFWTYILGIDSSIIQTHAKLNSFLKIAYSMFESSEIPPFWVAILNSYYDCVCVPDKWLVDVYKDCGVQIPIFVLSLGIWIEDFLAEPIYKRDESKPFTFGMTASFHERKNHIKVLDAFKQSKFANDPNYLLKLHGRFGPQKELIEKAVKAYGLSNVQFLSGRFSDKEYLEFMKSLDCYVFISKGEGFSITPREAKALGTPVILSQNTAHLSIDCCYMIKSNIKVPAMYELFGNKQLGNFYDCNVDDVTKTMEGIVDGTIKINDSLTLEEDAGNEIIYSYSGREIVKKYLWENLRKQYLQLLKPTNVIFDTWNDITNNKIQTNSNSLYKKLVVLKEFYAAK